MENKNEQVELIKNFLDEQGRLKAYPSKQRIKMAALAYLASKFEAGRRYPEKELNAILESWHTFGDFYMLRRDMCDRGFMSRERDCSFYWLNGVQPEL